MVLNKIPNIPVNKTSPTITRKKLNKKNDMLSNVTVCSCACKVKIVPRDLINIALVMNYDNWRFSVTV